MKEESIPISFIKDFIDKCYRMAGNSTPECERFYGQMARNVKSLLNDWEINGERWLRESDKSD